MILVDIGNTNIHFAWEENNKIKRSYKLPTALANFRTINSILSKTPKEKILICSVVPKINEIFKKTKRDIYIVGEDIKVPIRTFYNKRQVGVDRLVASFCALKIYPQARIVIDFGTAITFDFLSKKGDYLGGFILPGIGSTFKVFSNCALLPNKIKFKKTKSFIPKNTRDSINKGIEEGFSLMINSLVKKYKKKLNFYKKVVITGGDARTIIPKFNFSYIYEPFLIIKGLIFLSKDIKERFCIY
ncbi:MAG: type III pantothenate kinase [Candidatus Aenigmatarchaeota archaeon]